MNLHDVVENRIIDEMFHFNECKVGDMYIYIRIRFKIDRISLYIKDYIFSHMQMYAKDHKYYFDSFSCTIRMP